jgi:hypothetical protein
MIVYKLLLGFIIGFSIHQLIIGHSSLLQVYSHFQMGASGGSEFEGSMSFGEH